MQNKVIINADDFGLTESCSLAIAEAFRKNLISSTTACANGEYIEKAVALAKEKGFLGKIGAHLNITEGIPLTEGIKSDGFFCRDGVFHGEIPRLKKVTDGQLKHFKEEITAQLERLFALGVNVTHIDSHHHIHTCPYLVGTVKEVALKFSINKIRLHRNAGKIRLYKKIGKSVFNKNLKKSGFITTEKFCSVKDLEFCPSIIEKYVCEIMTHPDFDKEGRLIDRVEISEGGAFGAPLEEISKFIGGAKLISYGELE